MRGKKRPQVERARAVGLALVAGVPAAAKETGISERSLRRYMDEPEMAELAARNNEAVNQEWNAFVQKGFRRAIDLLDRTDDPVKAATTAAIIFDKLALRTGQATTRTEHRSLTNGLDDTEKRKLRDFVDGLPAEEPARSADESGDPAGAGAEIR